MDQLLQLVVDNQGSALTALAGIAAYFNRGSLAKILQPKGTVKVSTTPEIADDDRDVGDILAVKRLLERARATGNARLKECANQCLVCLFSETKPAE